MLQWFGCLLREPREKQYKEKQRRSLTWTIRKLLKFCAHVQEIHQPDWQKQHGNLGLSNSLPIICILPLQCGWFTYFGLVGSTISCVPSTLINLLVTNLFYLHAQHQMIEAARWDKNGVLQSVQSYYGQLVARSVMWRQHSNCRSPNQPIRRSQKHESVSLNISSLAENCVASKCWRTVFGLFNKASWLFVKVHEEFAKLY